MKRTALGIVAGIAAVFASTQVLAQGSSFPPPPKVSPAVGVIDLHVHSHPDVFGRSMDDVDVAHMAKARGMRGFVIKNHVSETGSRAALAMKAVPGIEIFSGIVLNKAVGGVNPDAVESSDLGQSANMTHPDGLEVAIAAMKREGISDADIDTLMRKNPAKLLGLN